MKALLLLFSVLLSSCVRTWAYNSKARPGEIEYHTANHFIWGFVDAEIESNCQHGIYQIHEDQMALTLLISISTLNFYTPTYLKIVCAKEEV